MTYGQASLWPKVKRVLPRNVAEVIAGVEITGGDYDAWMCSDLIANIDTLFTWYRLHVLLRDRGVLDFRFDSLHDSLNTKYGYGYNFRIHNISSREQPTLFQEEESTL